MQLKNRFKFHGILEYCSFLSVTKVSETEYEVSEGSDLLGDTNGSSGGSYTEKGNYKQAFINKIKEEYQSQLKFLARVQEEVETFKGDEYPDQGVLQDYYNMINDPCYDSNFVGTDKINLKYTGEFELENGVSYKFGLTKTEDEYSLVAVPVGDGETLTFSSNKNPADAFYSGFADLVSKIEGWLGQ